MRINYRTYYLCFLPLVHVFLVLFQEMGVEAFEAECVAKAEARAAQALPIMGLCLHGKVGVVDQFDEVIMPEVNVSRREFQEAARAAGALSKKEQKNRDFWQLRKDRKKATHNAVIVAMAFHSALP